MSAECIAETVTQHPGAPWRLYTERQRWGSMAVLFLVSTSLFYDRNVAAVLLEPIKQEFQISDTLLGLLSGFAFVLFYAMFGLPFARWADRGNRRTIITFALIVWSVMTVLCALSLTFWQLVLARVGVGAGEAGCQPTAQSLIADYFPPQRRSRAFSVFLAAGTAGSALGFGVGGYIAAKYGWRAAFLIGGVPGLVLSLVTGFGLAEPRRQLGVPSQSPQRESVRETLLRLLAKRSYLYGVGAFTLFFFVTYGALTFTPSYLVRVLGIPIGKAGATFGAVTAIGTLIGTLVGGWLGDSLGSRDIRWLAWLGALVCALVAPLFAIAFAVDDLRVFIALFFLAWAALSAGMPAAFAAIHAVCGTSRRATAIAILVFIFTLLGSGVGPLVSGALSDAFSAVHGTNSLRYALIAVMPVLLGAAGLFYAFGCAMPPDIED